MIVPLIAAFGQTILMLLLGGMAIFLILLVLVQRGRGGGLAGALGGMGGSSAFGAKAGDVFTKITVVTATIWILLCIVAAKYTPDDHSRVDVSATKQTDTSGQALTNVADEEKPAAEGDAAATEEAPAGAAAETTESTEAAAPAETTTETPAEPSADAEPAEGSEETQQ